MRRFFPKVCTFVLGVVWLISKTSFAQVPVALPTEYFSDRDISLPVTVGDVTGQDIKAFLVTITYDATIFRIDGIDTDGALAEGFAIVFNTDTPGQVTIGGAHFEAMSGEGTLFQLNGTFVKKGTTDLVFSSFAFNEGNPAVSVGNGEISNSVRVSSEDESLLPEHFALAGNYPNPFNPTTAVQFDLPEAAEVSIQIADMLGRKVMTVPAKSYQAGANHRIEVDASSLASGMYVYRVVARGVNKTHTQTSTMTLIK